MYLSSAVFELPETSTSHRAWPQTLPEREPQWNARAPSKTLHLWKNSRCYVPRRSLASLSLASSLCYQATTPRRFESLCLTIHDREKLRDDLQRRTAILTEGNRFRHVRRITLVGFMLDGDESDAGPADSNHDGDDDSDSDSHSDSDSDFGDNPPFPYSGPAMMEQHKRAQAEAWLPFVEFVAQVPALKDLVYACTSQVPVSLLAALHRHHPRSRLHVRTFSLRSLYQERDQLHDIDPDRAGAGHIALPLQHPGSMVILRYQRPLQLQPGKPWSSW